MTKKKQSHQSSEISKVRSFETFREIGNYEESNLRQNEPSCINSLRVKKYRVTIEEIEESDEVICERIQSLWDNTTNHHHSRMLQDAAKKYGYILLGSFGNKVKSTTQNTSA